jgi:hypothetical protein
VCRLRELGLLVTEPDADGRRRTFEASGAFADAAPVSEWLVPSPSGQRLTENTF